MSAVLPDHYMHMGSVLVQEKPAISLTKSYLGKLWLTEISLATLPALTALRPALCLSITSLCYSPKHSIVNCRAHTFSWLASFLLLHDSLLVNESLWFPQQSSLPATQKSSHLSFGRAFAVKACGCCQGNLLLRCR